MNVKVSALCLEYIIPDDVMIHNIWNRNIGI